MTQAKDRKDDALELAVTRSMIAAFTPEKPLLVGKAMMAAIKADGRFDDLLDRIVLY